MIGSGISSKNLEAVMKTMDGGDGEITLNEFDFFVFPKNRNGSDELDYIAALRMKLDKMKSKKMRKIFNKCDFDDHGSLDQRGVGLFLRKVLGWVNESSVELFYATLEMDSTERVDFISLQAFVKPPHPPTSKGLKIDQISSIRKGVQLRKSRTS